MIRLLWQGGEQTHRGKHYTVDHATLYTLPEQPIPIAVAAARPKAAELAGRAGDGLVSTEPNEETVAAVPRRRRRRASVRAGPDLLGRDRGRGEADGLPALAPQRSRRHDQPGAATAVRLRRGRARASPSRWLSRACRAGLIPSRSSNRPLVGAGRLQPDRDPPGRPRPGQVLPLLGAGAATQARLNHGRRFRSAQSGREQGANRRRA